MLGFKIRPGKGLSARLMGNGIYCVFHFFQICMEYVYYSYEYRYVYVCTHIYGDLLLPSKGLSARLVVNGTLCV